MKPSLALQENRAAIRSVVERHRARNARVFGSVQS
jgi:predicted nucleotidyltransferase